MKFGSVEAEWRRKDGWSSEFEGFVERTKSHGSKKHWTGRVSKCWVLCPLFLDHACRWKQKEFVKKNVWRWKRTKSCVRYVNFTEIGETSVFVCCTVSDWSVCVCVRRKYSWAVCAHARWELVTQESIIFGTHTPKDPGNLGFCSKSNGSSTHVGLWK